MITRQQRRAAERAAKKARRAHLVEVIIYDDDCEALAPMFLPAEGTYVPPAELHAACTRLVEATKAFKRLERES